MPSDSNLLVSDDSGLIGLVDCAAYNSFVAEDWAYEQLMRHFVSEMAKRSVLVWDCGDGGGNYRIRIRRQISTQTGHREALGAIRATGEQLHIVSYTSLTMCAQFDDYRLPEKNEFNLIVPVTPSLYRVRIVQMYDPDKAESISDREPHFLVELELGEAPSWPEVAWRAA